MCCAPTQANADGIARGWVNGRLAMQYTNLQFRHCKFRGDGGIFGIDSAWFAFYQGGAGTILTNFSAYVSNIIVSKNYVGPIVGYP